MDSQSASGGPATASAGTAADTSVDAVVIGSGFGGSVTAYRLAAAGVRTMLLERGAHFAPSDFPRAPAAMRRNFWRPDEGMYGLFDIRSFRAFESVVSAGVGGGSLIYANVMLEKPASWFAGWPLSHDDFVPHYQRVRQVLGVTVFPAGTPETGGVTKGDALLGAARRSGFGETSGPAPLAVTFGSGTSVTPGARLIDHEAASVHPGVSRFACRLCGECDIGCRYGSKNTLDLTYLARASARHGEVFQLRALCEAVALRRSAGGRWTVDYVDRSGDAPLRREVTADRVIVAAGTFGTTELLLRTAKAGEIPASDALGKRFSGNGDTMGFVFANDDASELNAHPGPVVTSYVRVESGDGASGGYIQDAGYPEFLEWLVGTLRPRTVRQVGRLLATLLTDRLRRVVSRSNSVVYQEMRALLSIADHRAGVLPLLALGMDTPDGVMRLGRRDRLEVTWNPEKDSRYLDEIRAAMRTITESLDGTLLEDPKFLHRRWITVHPLGGAAMGEDAPTSVVDTAGGVHGAEGLHVVDGAVMPGPVGPNPSLTIAAFANRAASVMLDLSPDDVGP